MFDTSHLCPHHIIEMISELQKSDYGDSVLLKYHSRTITDPLLYRVYYKLNYPDIQEIPSVRIIQLLHTEYMQDFPPIDSELEYLKLNFVHPFFDAHFLPETIDFSIDPQKQEINSVNFGSFWRETKSSPCKSLSKTPAPKTTVRSKNGLKILSWKVREIVERLGSSTYQEVADSLVNETEEFEGDAKDEKNIRRRVYDALNVLIAAGVLAKNNKKVEILKKKTDPSIEKRKKYLELREKYVALQEIIERNKRVKSSTHSVFLPFYLVVVDKKNDKSVQVLTSLHRNEASVKVNQDFSIQHSDEILKKSNVQVNFSNICPDMHGFVKLEEAFAKPFTEYSILI